VRGLLRPPERPLLRYEGRVKLRGQVRLPDRELLRPVVMFYNSCKFGAGFDLKGRRRKLQCR
jgi:hypothetical protein